MKDASKINNVATHWADDPHLLGARVCLEKIIVPIKHSTGSQNSDAEPARQGTAAEARGWCADGFRERRLTRAASRAKVANCPSAEAGSHQSGGATAESEGRNVDGLQEAPAVLAEVIPRPLHVNPEGEAATNPASGGRGYQVAPAALVGGKSGPVRDMIDNSTLNFAEQVKNVSHWVDGPQAPDALVHRPKTSDQANEPFAARRPVRKGGPSPDIGRPYTPTGRQSTPVKPA